MQSKQRRERQASKVGAASLGWHKGTQRGWEEESTSAAALQVVSQHHEKVAHLPPPRPRELYGSRERESPRLPARPPASLPHRGARSQIWPGQASSFLLRQPHATCTTPCHARRTPRAAAASRHGSTPQHRSHRQLDKSRGGGGNDVGCPDHLRVHEVAVIVLEKSDTDALVKTMQALPASAPVRPVSLGTWPSSIHRHPQASRQSRSQGGRAPRLRPAKHRHDAEGCRCRGTTPARHWPSA